MKTSLQNLCIGLITGFIFLLAPCSSVAQTVFDANDVNITYNPANPPAQSPTQPTKWIRTNRMNWNTSSFKCYIYKGVAFRLKYPKTYVRGNGAKYPLLLFFGGIGEQANIYDNEMQLYWGGQPLGQAIDNGNFDGFLLCPQSSNAGGIFASSEIVAMKEVIENFLVPQVQVDPFRLSATSLSAGGAGVWALTISYPKLLAASLSISYTEYSHSTFMAANPFHSAWSFQGALDGNPPVARARAVRNLALQAGANFSYTEYPNLGHNCWNEAWSDPDFFPYISRVHKANPWPLFGRREFCSEDSVNQVIGVTAGFDGYEWRKNGVVMPGANSNTITVKSFGIYDCRIKRGSQWSPWSPIPVILKSKSNTVSPDPQLGGVFSKVLPSPDGKTQTELKVPEGYAGYRWTANNSTVVLGTTNTLMVGPGSYQVSTTEKFSCQSIPSNPFTVIDANGPNKPAAASGLVVNKVSPASLKLTWIADANATNAATNFEIYQATQPGGAYKFVAITGAADRSYIQTNLTAGVKYYYVVRAVNNTAGAPVSNEATAVTSADTQPPSSVVNLGIVGTTRNAIAVRWDAATDNAGVARYDIYINGIKNYSTTSTSYTLYNLDYNNVYAITIKAIDLSGNESVFSSQVSARTLMNGLAYKYYNYAGDWSVIPNFTAMAPQASGFTPNVTIVNNTQQERFAFLWEGYINIPVSGTYTFRTNSDDGSKLYIDVPYSYTATPLVNNDGLHNGQDRDGTIVLAAGVYPIAVSYFQKTDSYGISVSWKTPQSNEVFVPIPDAAFTEPPVAAVNVPAAPSALVPAAVAYNKVGLTWADNSNNETAFELFRSTSADNGFLTIARVAPNITTYRDTTALPATTYYYRVRAINQNGESAYDRTGIGADQAIVNVTTPQMPAPPSAPANLNVTAVNTTEVRIAWNNTSNDVTGFAIYRSYYNNQDYILVTTVSTVNTSYTDKGLFANASIYYKVKAISATGASDFSNEINVVTPGAFPALDIIQDQYMRFNSQLLLNINATDANAGSVVLQANNLPPFASFSNLGNGKGLITFTPSAAQQGFYNNISVSATNDKNNTTTRTFNLVVNDNYVPVVSGQSVVSVTENQSQQINLSATDNDAGDVLTWSFTGLPAFVTVTPNNRTVQLNIAPVSGNAGTYNVIAKADDGRNGTGTMALKIIVNMPSAAASTYIHLSPSTAYLGGGVWNSIGKVLAPNEVYPAIANPGFKNQNGAATTIRMSINFEPGITNVANYSGMNTGANSGVYPDKVLQAGYKLFWNKTYAITLAGLDPSKTYSFAFLGSFNTSSNADVSTKFTIGNTSVLLNALRNTQNTVAISNITPAADGTVSVNIAKGPANASAAYYINAIVITDGGGSNTAPPSKPADFRLVYENGAAKLTWTNTAAVLTSNEVYRATAKTGPYSLLNPGATNAAAQLYNDNTIQVNNTYYYYVSAKNNYGSTSTDTMSVTVTNTAPVISNSEAFIKTNQTTNINVQATDNPGDVITLKATGLPSFATFMDNGNGTGRIRVSPAAGNIGIFNTTITATDNLGESTSAVVKIYITDIAVSSTYVNFNATIPVAGIWNSFNKTPVANAMLTGLKNDLAVTGTTAITLVQALSSGNTGAVTNNNSGAYRDDVLQTFYAETSTSSKTVRITGLSSDANVRYNLVFMSSVVALDDRTTIFSSGGKTVSINAAGNTQKTVQINDLTASGGVIEYTVTKGPNSVAAYMNALVIQAYTSSSTLLSPDNVKAMGVAKDAIRLVWNNRVNGGSVEIYRSAAAGGPFSFVTSVDGNAGTFTDVGLQSNTEYFYKLKAVSAPNVSPFSNTISASTYAYSVFINFNRDNPAALPWNNTNTDPQSGAVYSFLYTDQKNYSGISMTVGDGFSGTNANGENTGNNSGVVPDNVMRSVWWVDIGQTAQLKFSGLSQNMSYSFTFFASRTAADTRITSYIINGKVVKLQVNNNRTRTVTMDNVYADANGEVVLTIRPDGAAGQYSYIGGLIISGAKKPSDPIEGTGGAAFRSSDGSVVSGEFKVTTPNTKTNLNVYPNPFTDDVMVKLNLANTTSKLVIKVTDASGRLVLTREYSNVQKGSWLQAVGLDKQKLPAGVYFIQVQGINGETLAPIRVLKTK